MSVSTYTLSEIYCYPIKSLGGIALTQATVLERGLQYDRRWLLVDDNHQFLTQRQNTSMALLHLQFVENGFEVRHIQKEIKPCFIPFEFESLGTVKATVWDDTCAAQLINPTIDAWFSDALGISCKLVYMPLESERPVHPKYTAGATKTVSFADAFPYLIIGQAALDHLNERLEMPIPINRFRPNMVFSGGLPHEEDTWRQVKIGEAIFYGVKPCARCQVPTIDQNTGVMSKEPTRTLAKYRRKNNHIYFGENLVADSFPKTIKVGDNIEVMSYK